MSVIFRLLALGASAAAGWGADKMVSTMWKKTTGDAPPQDDENAALRSVIVFAVVSAAVGAVVQTLVGRGTRRMVKNYTKNQDMA